MKKVYEQPDIEMVLFQSEVIADNSGTPGLEPSNSGDVGDGW